MESSPFTIAPLLLRNLLASIFIHADNSLFHLSEKFKLLEFIRSFLVSAFLFFISVLPSIFTCLNPSHESQLYYSSKSTKDDNHPYSSGGAAASCGGDSGVSRAMSQLLLIMNDIPVSSRKYEVVRSLAEKLIDENLAEGNQALRDINCAVLSVAFARTLSQLEAAQVSQGRRGGGDGVAEVRDGDYYFYEKGSRWLKGVKNYGSAVWRYAKSRNEVSRSGSSAEKLAAELLWLAEKMVASGCAEEAVCKWASASNLAWLALSAEPRLQAYLVKVSAFLIRQAKDLGEEDGKSSTPSTEQQKPRRRQIKMKILMSWLPLLCRATNGPDSPILNMVERVELERILEEIIATLEEEEEQERVLSLWLHHYTYCPASDWPNLRSSYTRWFQASRARLLRATASSVN